MSALRVIGPLAAVSGLILAARPASAYQEPEYEVLEQTKDYEVRRYRPYLVAETTVEGSHRQATSKGFRILASYIFGNNRARTKMKMTTPVTTAPSVKMKMTTPVTTARAGKSRYVVQFVMERKYDAKTLPAPNDSRVVIRRVPARVVAVRRYSGRITEANYQANREKLLASLRAARVATTGKPWEAVYDGPYTLPFRRRNEVLVEIVR